MGRLPAAVLLLAAMLGGCAQQGAKVARPAAISRPSPDDLVPRGIAYACENNKEVQVVYAKNRATVTFENRTWRTEYQPTGDGFRYTDSSVQWIGRDDLASLRENGSTGRPLAWNCRPTRLTT